MKPRISMITLGVSDLSRAIDFYRNGLQFPQLPFDSPQVAFFTLKGTWLGLHPHHLLKQDACIEAIHERKSANPHKTCSQKNADNSVQQRQYQGFALAHNLESCAEVDSLIEQAIVAGATLLKKPQKTHWGGYHGYFSDPDGHCWEIAWNPYMWVGPKD